MEPITAAIVAALAVGVTDGTRTVAEQAVTDGYTRLKRLLKREFGESSELVESVENLEKKPTADSRKAQLAEAVADSQAQLRLEVVQVAQALLDTIREKQPEGDHIVQQAYGMNIAQASGGSSASVNVHMNDEGKR